MDRPLPHTSILIPFSVSQPHPRLSRAMANHSWAQARLPPVINLKVYCCSCWNVARTEERHLHLCQECHPFSLPGSLISSLVFSKLIPRWDFKSSSTVIPNTLFHKEAGLLGSELTDNDCFLLEMAQDGLAFGTALPAHQQGVQDLMSTEMSCIAGGSSETLLFKKQYRDIWVGAPAPSRLIWSGMEKGPQGNSPVLDLQSVSLARARSEPEKKTVPFSPHFG